MIMSMKLEVRGRIGSTQECAGCSKKIHDRYVLKALDMYWHEDCLKCGCCDCRLGEVGNSLYTKGNLLLCKRDYLRLFGSTGYCSACNKVIPAFEMVMRARTNVYHLECFACQQCGHRFCVGDHFYLYENKILCGPDYEERMVFANLSSNPRHLAQLKSQSRSPLPPFPPQPPAGHGSMGMNGPGLPPPPHHLDNNHHHHNFQQHQQNMAAMAAAKSYSMNGVNGDGPNQSRQSPVPGCGGMGLPPSTASGGLGNAPPHNTPVSMMKEMTPLPPISTVRSSQGVIGV